MEAALRASSGLMGKSDFIPQRLNTTKPSRRQEQEKINAQFYECYCKTAEEYDRKFTESYRKKMNKTVVAVRDAHFESDIYVLTWIIGWPVLYHDFGIHQGYQLPAPTRSEREGRHSPL